VAKCLLPGCGNEAVCRGQCRADYRASRNLIEAGKTTWAKLERRGLAAKPQKTPRVKAALGLVKSKSK
jgi:hypothetical protein